MPFLRRVNHRNDAQRVHRGSRRPRHRGALRAARARCGRGDIDGAQNYAEMLPTGGADALVDRTENPVFDGEKQPLARWAAGQPSHSQRPRPMIHSLSWAESHGSSSVKSVTACRHGQGSRVQSVPQNIRRGPNASYTRRMCGCTSGKG